MAAGMSQQEILHDFPDLTETDILACLAFAADGEHAFDVITTLSCFSMKISLLDSFSR